MTQAKAEEMGLFAEKPAGRAETGLTAREAAARLGLSQRHTQKLAKSGLIEGVLAGGKYRITPASVDRYLQQRSGGQEPEVAVADVPPVPASSAEDLARLHEVPVPILVQQIAGLERQLEEALGREKRLLRLLETVLRVPLEVAPVPLVPSAHHFPEPDPASLLGRILAYLRAKDTAKWVHQIQRDLDLPRPPNRELSTLVSRGLVQRQKLGLYIATPLVSAAEGARDAPHTS